MNTQELANLLKEYRKFPPESVEATQIKAHFIAQLSSSYWWNSPHITNLFYEDVRQIKGKLQQELEDKLQHSLNKNYDLKKMTDFLLEEALILQKKYQKELITDELINTLAIQTKKTQLGSLQRKQSEQLLIKAMDVKNTYKKQGLKEKFNLSQEDYEDALQESKGESIRYVLNNIDRYDETKGAFMAVINHWISTKFPDVAGRILGLKKSQVKKQEEDKIIMVIEDANSMTDHLSKKDEKIEQEFACNQKSADIKNLVEEDPNKKLSKPIRKDRTDITFKDVLIAINWEGETFKSLSTKWQIPYTTIKSFYDREFQQVKTDLVDYLQ